MIKADLQGALSEIIDTLKIQISKCSFKSQCAEQHLKFSKSIEKSITSMEQRVAEIKMIQDDIEAVKLSVKTKADFQEFN